MALGGGRCGNKERRVKQWQLKRNREKEIVCNEWNSTTVATCMGAKDTQGEVRTAAQRERESELRQRSTNTIIFSVRSINKNTTRAITYNASIHGEGVISDIRGGAIAFHSAFKKMKSATWRSLLQNTVATLFAGCSEMQIYNWNSWSWVKIWGSLSVCRSWRAANCCAGAPIPWND